MAAAEAAAEATELSDTDRMLFSTIITSSGGARGEISRRAPGNQRRGGARLHSWAVGCSHGMREDAEAFASRRNRRELVAAGQGQLAHGGYKTSGGTARSRSALISRQVFVWRAWWRARGLARNRRRENAEVGRVGRWWMREWWSGTIADLKKGLKKNRLALHKLLNIPEEQVRMNEATNQEICDAVNEQRERAAGGETDARDSWWRPSHQQVLEAASTLREYLLDRNDAFARKLEDILVRFGRQTHLDNMKTMRETQMTDYFHRTTAEKH
ncbi:hypothetical protein B0H13DRAFT_1882305 [Mycena leptocephala]|nr:hypothetical protein B0H13DRAFT_1882305 [Mycena leptocephala]